MLHPYVITPLITRYARGSQTAKILLITVVLSASCSSNTDRVVLFLKKNPCTEECNAVWGNVHFGFDKRILDIKKKNNLLFLRL